MKNPSSEVDKAQKRLWNIYHPEIPDFISDAANTAAMQRLTDVGMNCGCEYTSFPLFSNIAPYSRFDHSLGVALIVWHFTQDRAQALAGLLHDVATPVFAHVIDFLQGDHMTQESTESETETIIRGSADLCQILRKNDISTDAVIDYHRYPIADNDAPKLAADRLEYTLGNALNYAILTYDQIREIYNDLTITNNESGEPELTFRTPKIAFAFSQAALECSKIYVSKTDRFAMEALALLLKECIKNGILTKKDLHTQEQHVIRKILDSNLSNQWSRFIEYKRILYRDTPGSNGMWLQVHAKKRYIDPKIQGVGRVSSTFNSYHNDLLAFLTKEQNEWLSAE